MNQYPVLFLSFKDVEANCFEDAYQMLEARLGEVCKNLEEEITIDRINKADAVSFENLMFEKARKSEVKNSLKTLMRILHSIYGKKVILLIDEYDVPLAKASEKNTKENRYYEQMLDIIRGIMGTALKDNEFLELAVVTGCLRIAKESIFTGTNNFSAYSVLDRQFSNYFGFTEEEVDKMLEAAEQTHQSQRVKEWYNGYVFGNSYVYCPWDVVNYLSVLRAQKDAQPKNFWTDRITEQ